MRNTSLRYKAFEAAEILKIPIKGIDADAETGFLKQNDGYAGYTENQIVKPWSSSVHYCYVCVGRKWKYWHENILLNIIWEC